MPRNCTCRLSNMPVLLTSSKSFAVRPVNSQCLHTLLHPSRSVLFFIMFPQYCPFSKLALLSIYFPFCYTPFEKGRLILCVILNVWSGCAFAEWPVWLTAASYIKHLQACVVSIMAVVGFRLNWVTLELLFHKRVLYTSNSKWKWLTMVYSYVPERITASQHVLCDIQKDIREEN